MELSLINLLLVLLAGWLAGWGASRLGYPSVLGELLIGIVLGPPALGLLQGGEALGVLAEIGILLMLLYVGMEIDPRELGRASWGGMLAAVGGFITPFVLAYLTMIAFGYGAMGATFVGIAAGVTSLTTKSRILVDLRLLDTRVAHVMMAGALISDTVSLILFAGVLGVLEAGALDLTGIAVVGLKVVAFFAVAFLLGLKLFPILGKKLTEVGLTSRTFHFTFVLMLAVAFGELAHLAGLHAILGAFLAGLFLRDNVLGRSLSQDLMGAVRDSSIGFLAPIFFVTAGFQVSLSVFRDDLLLLLAIIGVATVGKVIGTATFYTLGGNNWREGLTIGGGMNGRGAVEIIVAGIALEMGLITTEVFSILVFMAIFTTATVPFFLKWGTEWLRRRGELVRSDGHRSGLIILGAGPTARELARALAPSQPVRLVDTNPSRCQAAEEEGLSVTCGDALREQTLGEARASEAAALLALTPNVEVNALVAQMARSVFMVPEVLVAADDTHSTGHAASMHHLQASTLFGVPVAIAEWDYWIGHGAVQRRQMPVGDERTALGWLEAAGGNGHLLPVAVVRGGERLPFHADQPLRAGDEVLVLERADAPAAEGDRFDELVASAVVADIPGELSLDRLFARVAEELGRVMGLPQNELFRLLWEREQSGSTVLTTGLAIPHVLLPGEGRFELFIARCADGVRFPAQADPVTAVFVLAGTADERTLHLRALSAITQIAHDRGFEERWAAARDAGELREMIRWAKRRRF